MDRLDKAILLFFVVAILLPQGYLIVTSDTLEAGAARMAFVTGPALCGIFAAFGWVVSKIKGRG